MNPGMRYLARAVLTGISGVQGSLLTTLTLGQPMDVRATSIAVLVGLGGFLAYLGIGAASSNVEPAVHHNGIDSKKNDPENDK